MSDLSDDDLRNLLGALDIAVRAGGLEAAEVYLPLAVKVQAQLESRKGEG